jgi:hypothetical protein
MSIIFMKEVVSTLVLGGDVNKNTTIQGLFLCKSSQGSR